MQILFALLMESQLLLSAGLAPAEEFCVDCCSLYCAVTPEITTSIGEPQTIGDGDLSSVWAAPDNGRESIEFKFRSDREDGPLRPNLGIDSIFIATGGAEDRDLARPRNIDLLIDGELRARIRLIDTPTPQKVSLPRFPLHDGLRVSLRIVDAFTTANEQKVGIREIRIDGYGHH